MAGAEHEVLVARDAMTVYSFLLDGANLPRWQTDVRSVGLVREAQAAWGPGTR